MEEEQDREKGMDNTDQIVVMIPKLGAFSEDHRRNSRLEIARVCEDCGKVFSSGKAYGGHKRIHRQPIKGELIPETKLAVALINKEGYYCNSDGEYNQITCSECGRRFPTWKSLFGHMRCHPERAWRGIRQPAPAPAPVRASYCSSSSTLSWEDHDEYPAAAATGVNNLSATAGSSSVDMMVSLKGTWAATGKRGRSAITEDGRINKGGGEEDDDKMKQGVNDLLMFAKIPQPNCQDPELNKQSRKKKRLDELDDESKPGREFFPCNICNKQFSCHQALGGHKASHNNKLRKPETTDWSNGGGEAHEQHKCNICGLIFPTGQALGGHKRRHWIGSPAGSSSHGTGQVIRPVLLDFDLNQPPPPPAPVDDLQVNAQSASLSNSISD